MINSILSSSIRIYKRATAKMQGWRGVRQNFTKVVNMKHPKLKKNPATIFHVLKNILKNDKNKGIYRNQKSSSK